MDMCLRFSIYFSNFAQSYNKMILLKGAQSDSLLTHTFSTMVSYSEVMLICDFDFIFRSIFELF